MIERYLDYLQFTAWMQEADFASKEEYRLSSGLPYYPRGYKDESGTRFYFGHNKGANCFVVLAGEQLQYFRDVGAGDKGVLEWAFANGAKVSRIDLAVTEYIDENLFQLEDIETWYAQGQITSYLTSGGCKKIVSVLKDGKNQQETLYIGDVKQRARKGIFRAYDKGIDIGIGAEIISRIELELKRERAQAVAKKLADNLDISGNFRTYFDVKHPDFERIMEAPAIEAVRGKAKPKTDRQKEDENRWIWLIKQVAPALKKAVHDDLEKGLGDENLQVFLASAGLTVTKQTRRRIVNLLDLD